MQHVTENIFIGVAWPYANTPTHVGQVAGCYLPADIFARYHRAKGNRVLMVSGSDQHGTPITVMAETEGITPAQLVGRVQEKFVETWNRLGISFDLFTSTGTANHAEIAQDFFLRLYQQGDLYTATQDAVYCPKDKRFLPDRYVEGTCPYCGYTRARGDQCENCGRTLDPTDLIDPRCRICGTTPEIRPTEHFYLRLSKYNQPLLDWASEQTHWRPNVRNFTLRYLEEGLKDRAITRDLEWGVPIPLPGYEQKRIYVWFEAVIGYLSASVEWAKQQGTPDAWKRWWQEPARAFYFIGKDNIPFHTMIWPMMLMAYGGLNLPYDVPANEFMTLEGDKISSSRNWAVWTLDVLDRYQPDTLRYYLAAAMPETNDGDFSWREFFRRNNDELVATYGNLAHRVLTFTVRHFDGKVPDPGVLRPRDEEMLARIDRTFLAVDAALGSARFRDALREAMSLAQEANRYLDEQAPWQAIKTDHAAAGRGLWVTLQAINGLKTVLEPFLPFSSAKLHALLGFGGKVADDGYAQREVPAGQQLGTPEPIFVKLDEVIVEQEVSRLGG